MKKTSLENIANLAMLVGELSTISDSEVDKVVRKPAADESQLARKQAQLMLVWMRMMFRFGNKWYHC